ncbi:MAG: T9SS type A sorting domain-containing protein [Bacteroidales bacterium]|nr:T9SS type A sorting domain-containing protein [Bacteroidales bacterium]
MKKLLLSAVLIGTAIFTANAQSVGTLIDMADVTPSANGTGWTFAGNIYTILDGATVTITGTNTNQRRIAVAAGASVSITLDNVTIEGLGAGQTPLLLNDGAKVMLTLEGTNSLVAGSNRAAIQVPDGTELTITGTGSLTARAIQQSAGIGGGQSGSAGMITINSGTITAIGGTMGAGIGGGGGGGGGAGGIVTIYNGIVTAIGGGWSAQGIGRGAGGGGGWGDPDTASNGVFAMNGDAVVFASSIDDTNKNRRINGILFVNNSGIFHGSSVTLTDDVTIPDGAGLVIPEGVILTIPEGITLTNNGTVTNCGIINKGGNYGTWEGNEPTVGGDIIDLSAVNPALPCDRSWTFANNIYTIHDGATVTITGTSINQRHIVVAANASVNITLENAVITGLAANQSPLSLNNGANVTLTLLGTNTLAGGSERTAIEVPEGTTLTIEGSGSLTASSGWDAAGIGSNRWNSSGMIIINGGIITSTGNSGGAGIGGGDGGSGGTIVINGGHVTARGGSAGIGDGARATGSNITINAGVVNASGGSSSAGIGGGEWAPSGNGIITINGGHVTAVGGGWGAGIGTGNESRANFAITISGGFIEARGGTVGEGIGRGRNSDNIVTFTLNGNAVVIASSIGDTNISRRTSGILLGTYIDSWGTFYGNNVTLTDDVTTRFRTLLRIPRNATLTIPKGITFTNNGTIINCGTINKGGSHGTWAGNEPVLGSDNNMIDLSIADPEPPCDGSWIFANNIYTIFDGANITITGTSINERLITVAANANVNITLEDATLSVAERSWESPFLLRNGANLTLTLVGTNTLIAGYRGAGLWVWEGTTLTITGTGSLMAIGGYGGTGIGGSWLGGNIIINDGVITAIGGSGAQGIGNSEEGGMPSTLTLNGNAIVFTNSVSDTDQRRRTSGILVIENTTYWYGNPEFILSGDATIPETHTLTIDAGKTLTIPIGTTLTNNGTVRNCGTINKGGSFGVWIGNEPTLCTETTINTNTEKQGVVKIYPNPVTDLLHIVIPSNARDLSATVELFDMNGRRVFSQPIIHYPLSTFHLQITIDMTPFPQGVYILRIGNHAVRVVKQ